MLRDAVPPSKDVEGLCHSYRWNLYHNLRNMPRDEAAALGADTSGGGPGPKCLVPCTPLAVAKVRGPRQRWEAVRWHRFVCVCMCARAVVLVPGLGGGRAVVRQTPLPIFHCSPHRSFPCLLRVRLFATAGDGGGGRV